MAFFEVHGAEMFSKGAGGPAPYPVQFDHLSFNVADEAALLTLRERLTAAGTEVTTVVDHGSIQSVYFSDNNGIALEASYWVDDPTQREEGYGTAHFLDPDPVPAIAELAAEGLKSVPATRLA